MKRVYELKHREDSKAMLVLLDDVGKLASYVEVPDVAYELLEVIDKPMTIIYPNAKNLAKNLIAPDRTIGIRITSEDFTKSLLYRFRKPIVSTSANISGEPSPRCFAEISDAVKTAVDYVVDFRQEETTNPPAGRGAPALPGAAGGVEPYPAGRAGANLTGPRPLGDRGPAVSGSGRPAWR